MTTPDTDAEQAIDAHVLLLPEVIDISTVGSLRDQIQQRRGGPLHLDGRNVQRVGGLGVQLMLAAAAAWAGDGGEFSLKGASAPLRETLRLTGASIEGMHS